MKSIYFWEYDPLLRSSRLVDWEGNDLITIGDVVQSRHDLGIGAWDWRTSEFKGGYEISLSRSELLAKVRDFVWELKKSNPDAYFVVRGSEYKEKFEGFPLLSRIVAVIHTPIGDVHAPAA